MLPRMDHVPCVELQEGEIVASRGTHIREALAELGFVRIAGHGVDPQLVDATYLAFQRFFALPAARKKRRADPIATSPPGLRS